MTLHILKKFAWLDLNRRLSEAIAIPTEQY